MASFSNLSYLMIETNSACNLSCLSCNRSRLVEQGQRALKNLTPKEWNSMLLKFKDCPLEMIKVEGLSEPMLHPQFDQLLKMVRDYFPKAYLIIATNLQYDFTLSPFKSSLPFADMVYLSLDGTGDLYEQLRPPAKWASAVQWLEDASRILTPEERSKKLHINFTVTEKNLSNLPQIYELKNKYGLASVRINLAQDWNGDQRNQHDFGESFLDGLKPYLKDLKGVAGWSFKDCFWPYEGMVVDVFGNIRQCVINTSQVPLANIFEVNLPEFYNQSLVYQKLRKSLENDLPGEACLNCDYKYLASKLQYLFGEAYKQNLPRKFKR